MLQKESQKNTFLYYLLAIMGSLSTAGASMTLLALSASFYAFDQEGVASSSIYVLYYFGIGVVGFAGGWILQRFTAITLGITGALVSAAIVFYLSSFSQILPIIGLPAVFLIFLLNGIDHPNNLRFFNEAIAEKKKMAFFSTKEGATYVLGLITPALAALIIKLCGAQICFLIDGGTYILSCVPWLILRQKQQQEVKVPMQEKPNWFIGFKLLLTDSNIRLLNISRLLNNLAYVTWTTALPLLLAKIVKGDADLFAQEQGISTSLISAGFLLASLLGTWLAKDQKLIRTMIWSSSLLGFASVLFLSFSLFQSKVLYVSAFLLGLGTYCFRISGMTLGQAFTPKKMLGAVIVAGDAVVRGWSFFVSLAAIAIFSLHETWEMSTKTLGILMLALPSFSLISPFLIGRLAKTFIERNQTLEQKDSTQTVA